MSVTNKVTRELIEKHITKLNEIENARPSQSAEQITAKLSALLAENIEGWINGKHVSGRSTVNDLDRRLYELVDDYHRDIYHLVIDPPFASIDWCIKSAKHNMESQGCSIIEFDGAGLQLRFWMYFDPAPLAKIGFM